MIDQGLLSGLPNGVRALLASPPLTDPRLLELAARWEGLPPAQARVADSLRLFVVTWDPLEWLAPRPAAVATANAWPLEFVVYVPVWSLTDLARRKRTTMAAVLARLGGSANHHRRQGTEAVMLSEELARVDPARRAFFGGQAALALAEAGHADDARVKIAEHVERWPADAQTRMLSGDALAVLGDAEAALAQYQAALPLAQQVKDYRSTRELSERIFRLTHSGSAQSAVQRRQLRSKPSRSRRKDKR
jgi:tetratricopeptide (TPR) repeat protein